jgi:hypothetical protein
MFDNKVGVLVVAVILCVIFWLVGGAVFKATFGGMICVIIGIALVGLAVGNLMDTPCPSQTPRKSS